LLQRRHLCRAVLFGAGSLVIGERAARLACLVREPILLALSTASFEAACPARHEISHIFG